jgi:hypothetical protein
MMSNHHEVTIDPEDMSFPAERITVLRRAGQNGGVRAMAWVVLHCASIGSATKPEQRDGAAHNRIVRGTIAIPHVD